MATTSGPAKKASAKKTTAKKTATKAPTKKSAPAKKAPARKTPAKKAPRQPAKQSAAAPPSRKMSASAIAREAIDQLLELTGRQSEGVTALEKNDDGWRVQVQVVEVRRIPETTDVLGLYDVEMDADGDLLGYRRVRRYTRGEPGEE